MQLYRMHDADPRGVFPVTKEEAPGWNAQGHGIFVAVNEFSGARRRENLTRINAWAIDLDEGTKLEQKARLLRSPLVPSMVIETKNGFHAWWIAKEAKADHWNAVVLERLVPFFGADKNARDLCRILRFPGFDHLKDPANPFPVRLVWQHHVGYTERQMAQAFRWVPSRESKEAAHQEHRAQRPTQTAENVWEAIYQLDCEEGLSRLSGHHAVNGERYTFKRAPRGRLNIIVDGKGSPCFIDENKRIGSPSGGGPTLVQWLRWFGRSYKEALDVICDVFPQLQQARAT